MPSRAGRPTRVQDLDAAVGAIPAGSVLYAGGAVLRRKPMALLRALADSGVGDLELVTFAGSLDVEVLVAAGAVRSVSAAYVGLGHHGFAPRFGQAVRDGAVVDAEHTEWSLLGRLRAAAMGVPFLPTRAGAGSEIVGALGYARVRDPYGDGEYLALPPLRPDVAVLHGWRASAAGDVQMAWPPEHLWDIDVLAARAARTVVVTVEEIVPAAAVAAEPHLTRLFGFEVDCVVEVPGGAWPTASPPVAEADERAIAAYAAGGDGAGLLGQGARR